MPASPTTAARGTLWVIVTPVFKPAPGGGAIYSDILARALAGAGADVVVFAERHPGTPAEERLATSHGSAQVRRIFPFRAGRADRDWRSYLAYATSNLIYTRLPGLIRRERRRLNPARVRVLIHSSLLYHPNLLHRQIARIRRAGGGDALVIADVRDFSFPDARLGVLRRFDAVVTSSEKVADELRMRLPDIPPTTAIPMPFEMPRPPTAEQTAAVIERCGLVGRPFLLNPNGLATAKFYPQMRDGIARLRQCPGFEGITLVSVGRKRDRSPADDTAEARGEAIYLGPVGRETLLPLMQAARFTLVLSDREAISRAALEAMAVGGRVILPDLAEFRRECASHVLAAPTTDEIVRKLTMLKDEPMPRFCFDRHLECGFLDGYLGIGGDDATG